MLLGDDVSVRMTPGLDVRANDVAASHGARIDRVDETSLWYMMSRGIDRPQAQSLLVRGAITGMV
jgi:Fe-S cluster assembly protein SufD